MCIIANEGTGLVKLGQCNSASNWDCNSDNRLRPGIKLESTKKCIRVKDDQSVSLETCNAKQHGQSLIVYGTLNFMICTKLTTCIYFVRIKDCKHQKLRRALSVVRAGVAKNAINQMTLCTRMKPFAQSAILVTC